MFGGDDESPTEERQQDKTFDLLKYDGVKAMKIGRADYAVRCFQEALKLRDDPETHDYLSQVYLRLGELEGARAELQVLADAEPGNVAIMIRMAQVEFMREDYSAMETACQLAMNIDEHLPQPYVLAAQASVGQRNLKKAMERLDKAIALRDDYAEARLMRGQILLRAGNTAAAETDVDWLMDNVGEQEDVLLLKAHLETAKGHNDEAQRCYDMVIEANPFSVEAFIERSKLKLAAGDAAGAQEDLDAARELNPTEDAEDIEQQVKQAYKNVNPFGI